MWILLYKCRVHFLGIFCIRFRYALSVFAFVLKVVFVFWHPSLAVCYVLLNVLLCSVSEFSKYHFLALKFQNDATSCLAALYKFYMEFGLRGAFQPYHPSHPQPPAGIQSRSQRSTPAFAQLAHTRHSASRINFLIDSTASSSWEYSNAGNPPLHEF